MAKALRPHPAALIFPEMAEADFERLKDNIDVNGLLEPIWLAPDGRILDGRHRYRACRELRKTLDPNEDFQHTDESMSEEDLIDFVIGLNLHRRHLNESQRSMVAARVKHLFEGVADKKMKAGGKADPLANLPKGPQHSRDLAAEQLHVSSRLVGDATKVQTQAIPALVQAVDVGQIKVSGAARVSTMSKADQTRITKAVISGKAKNVKDAMRQFKLKEQIKAIENAKPVKGKFNVVVVDPAWTFDKTRSNDPTQRGKTPYPTMSEQEICAMNIPAAKDCILWLWTTNAHLATGEASRVLEAWGFQPKTILTWHKNKMGLGDWLRGKTEHCILAVKGKPKMKGPIPPTIFEADVPKEHSRKPDKFYKLVEKHCPGTKVELFARVKRKGWKQDGAELGDVK